MLFGDSIDIMEGLQITLLGMLVVFLALIFLMVILTVMEKIFYRSAKSTSAKQSEPAKTEVAPAESVQDDTELVAVIAAAVASSMGVMPSDLVIRNIVRMPETAPAWSLAGRTDQMNRMLQN